MYEYYFIMFFIMKNIMQTIMNYDEKYYKMIMEILSTI